MKFLGLGNDIVEIPRIEKAIKSEHFVNRVFTLNEIELAEKRNKKPEFFAGRFSAKEAISKALGSGVRGFNLKDIEIVNSELGKPVVIFKNVIEDYNNKFIVDISISHSKEYATSVAIIFEK